MLKARVMHRKLIAPTQEVLKQDEHLCLSLSIGSTDVSQVLISFEAERRTCLYRSCSYALKALCLTVMKMMAIVLKVSFFDGRRLTVV